LKCVGIPAIEKLMLLVGQPSCGNEGKQTVFLYDPNQRFLKDLCNLLPSCTFNLLSSQYDHSRAIFREPLLHARNPL
jgi:hypothetical protein